MICPSCAHETATLIYCRNNFICPACYRKEAEGPCDRCGEPGPLCLSEDQTELLCRRCWAGLGLEDRYV
jgi:hypothetical protein